MFAFSFSLLSIQYLQSELIPNAASKVLCTQHRQSEVLLEFGCIGVGNYKDRPSECSSGGSRRVGGRGGLGIRTHLTYESICSWYNTDNFLTLKLEVK